MVLRGGMSAAFRRVNSHKIVLHDTPTRNKELAFFNTTPQTPNAKKQAGKPQKFAQKFFLRAVGDHELLWQKQSVLLAGLLDDGNGENNSLPQENEEQDDNDGKNSQSNTWRKTERDRDAKRERKKTGWEKEGQIKSWIKKMLARPEGEGKRERERERERERKRGCKGFRRYEIGQKR